MIKVSVLYPNEEGKAFDWDYYCVKHVPMVMGLLGDRLKKAEIVQGISGGVPGSKPAYIAVGQMYFDTIDDFLAALSVHNDQIMGDIPNYTNVTPLIDIGEVKM